MERSEARRVVGVVGVRGEVNSRARIVAWGGVRLGVWEVVVVRERLGEWRM